MELVYVELEECALERPFYSQVFLFFCNVFPERTSIQNVPSNSLLAMFLIWIHSPRHS